MAKGTTKVHAQKAPAPQMSEMERQARISAKRARRAKREAQNARNSSLAERFADAAKELRQAQILARINARLAFESARDHRGALVKPWR